tara:strand:- start:580 stop:1323 length:744 start_codon:yes stop_codon:yes gene_type:complete
MAKMPKWNNPMSDLDLIKALSWFHAYSNETKTKRYIRDYIQMFKSSLIPHLKNLNEYVIQDVSCAYIAHLITEGYDIPQSPKKKFTIELEKNIIPTLYKTDEKKVAKKPKPKKVNRETIVDAGELEHQLDTYISGGCQGNTFTVYKYLQGKNAKQMDATEIKKWFKPLRDELEDALKIGVKYKDLRESYSFLTKPQLKRLTKYVDTMILDCDKYMKEKRVTRTTKKKKNGTSETQVSLENHLVELSK